MESDLSWATALLITVPLTVVMVGAGLFVKEICERAADGRMGRNRWAGVRTPATLASDEAWHAGQAAALDDSVRGAMLGTWISVVAFVVAWILGAFGAADPDGVVAIWTVLLLLGVTVMTALIVRGAIRGNAAAKAVGGDASGG